MLFVSSMGYPCSITCLPGFGKSVLPLIWSYHFIIITYDPMLSPMLPNSRFVSLICSREVLFAVLYYLYTIWFSTIVLNLTFSFPYILRFMLMMWDSLWPIVYDLHPTNWLNASTTQVMLWSPESWRIWSVHMLEGLWYNHHPTLSNGPQLHDPSFSNKSPFWTSFSAKHQQTNIL